MMTEEMKRQLSEISFTIVNNTSSNVPMNFLGNLANTADISNQLTEYKWDVTGILFAAYDTVTVQVRGAGSSLPFTTLSATIPIKTIQGALDALNSLNVACFFSSTSGGNTYIETYNDNTEFGDIDFSSSTGYSTWFLGYRGSYAGTGGSWNIENPTPTVIYTGSFPVVQSPYVDISAYLNYSSNQITFNCVAGSLTMNMAIYRLDLATNTETLINSVTGILSGNSASIGPITAAAGYVYIIDFS